MHLVYIRFRLSKDSMKNLMTKMAFAELAGVSGSAVGKAANHGSLRPAMVKKRIDANHEAAIKYLASPSRMAASAANKIIAVTREIANGPQPSGQAALKMNKKMAEEPDLEEKLIRALPPDIRKLAHKSLSDLVDIFGTDVRFGDWLKTLKLIEEISAKRIANAATLKELVSRDIIRRGVLEPIDGVLQRLLTDGVRTIAQRLHTKYKTGATSQEGEAYMKKEITKILKPISTTVEKTLRAMVDDD